MSSAAPRQHSRSDTADKAVRPPAASTSTETGTPLPGALRQDAERRFGVDFGAVRIHAGPVAARAAHSLGAAAYTLGRDVVFGANRWQPGQAAGQRLLAHELAHVVQQSRPGLASGDAEARADTAAGAVLHGHSVATGSLGAAPLAPQAQPEAEADGFSPVEAAPPLPVLGALPQTLAAVSLEASDTLTKDNPRLVQIAAAWRAQPAARVRLSADLPESTQSASALQAGARARLSSRMRQIRDALQQLGVDADSVDVGSATAFSTAARGQVDVAVRQAAAPQLPFDLPKPGIGPAVPPAPPAAGPSLDLEFEFGPVKVSLPKEVRAKLPIALSRAYKLTLDLSYEVPAKFGMQLMLDGLPYLRVGLKAGAEVDTKSGAATASAGLVIETTLTTCNAADPGETREKIKTAGDKLNKAAREFEIALPDDKLGKAIDIASAIGEIYGAVEAAKARCKQVPRATLELGAKKVLAPGSASDPDPDPAKRPADYVGGTFTFHF